MSLPIILPNELDRLISASERGRAKNYLPAMILLGAEHGAAKQEVLSLKWSDIDFDYEENGIIRTFRTKNRMERFDSLMPRTKKALLHWRKHLEWMRHRKKILTIKSDYVFCRLDGTPLKRFDSAWKRALKLAGIDNFHFHDLRHTFCSNLMLSGTDLKGASEMIGHRDINMTNRYSHLTNSYRKELQRRLNEHYQGKN